MHTALLLMLVIVKTLKMGNKKRNKLLYIPRLFEISRIRNTSLFRTLFARLVPWTLRGHGPFIFSLFGWLPINSQEWIIIWRRPSYIYSHAPFDKWWTEREGPRILGVDKSLFHLLRLVQLTGSPFPFFTPFSFLKNWANGTVLGLRGYQSIH